MIIKRKLGTLLDDQYFEVLSPTVKSDKIHLICVETASHAICIVVTAGYFVQNKIVFNLVTKSR